MKVSGTKCSFGHQSFDLFRKSIAVDKTEPIHAELSSLGKHLHAQAQIQWTMVAEERLALEKIISVKVARRVLREWLTTNLEAQRAELLVEQLMSHA